MGACWCPSKREYSKIGNLLLTKSLNKLHYSSNNNYQLGFLTNTLNVTTHKNISTISKLFFMELTQLREDTLPIERFHIIFETRNLTS